MLIIRTLKIRSLGTPPWCCRLSLPAEAGRQGKNPGARRGGGEGQGGWCSQVASKTAPGLLRAIHHFDKKKKGNSVFVPAWWFGLVRPRPVYLLTAGIPGEDAGSSWCLALVATWSPSSLPGQCVALGGGVCLSGADPILGSPRRGCGGQGVSVQLGRLLRFGAG